MLWLLLGVASAGECPSELIDLERQVNTATLAFAGLDVDGFMEAMDIVNFDLTCLGEEMTPETAAHIHRANGIRLFTSGEEGRAKQALAAARVLAPSYVFPESLVPGGHPIRLLHDGVDPSLDHTLSVPPPREGHLAFDGKRGVQRPADRASIVQLFDTEGSPTTTVYLFTESALPAYAAAEVFVPEGVEGSAGMIGQGTDKPDPLPTDKPEGRGPNRPLLVVAGASALLAGGLYAGAAASESAFYEVPFDGAWDEADDLQKHRARTHGLLFSSIGFGVVAVGSGAGAFIVGAPQ